MKIVILISALYKFYDYDYDYDYYYMYYYYYKLFTVTLEASLHDQLFTD